MSKIENLFIEKASNDKAFSVLLSQWNFDKMLIEKSLSNIERVFPHYSMHDSSHSEVILGRIYSVLGEESVQKLSITDLWLLLESSYMHDSGMIANAEIRKEDFESPEFLEFVNSNIEDKSELGNYCRIIKSESVDNFLELDNKHQYLIYVYSEYVRREHADRAEEAILDPLETLKAELPRNHLIPARLWHIISEVSKTHGKKREDILELPYQENGINEEVCHPRFIASMLRIGDLLDIERDRFHDSKLAMLSEIPASTKAHIGKHSGIKHLLVSTKTIIIEGVYEDVDEYIEAENWFNLLRKEISFSTLKWGEINPVPSVGSLPNIEKIEAKLVGQIVLDEGSRPQFELDREKVLDLVKGSNIYKGPQDGLRELLQNSVDATLLRYSYENQRDGNLAPKSVQELRRSLEEFPININFKRIEINDDNVKWEVKIKDNGIGLSLNDIKFMLKLGSSRRNKEREKLAIWLPDWGKPSGSFGIGFHSIFSYAKNVVLTTRHPESSESFELNFSTDEKSSEPRVIVKNIKNKKAYLPLPGTEIQFDLSVEKVPQRLSFTFGEDWDEIKSYDFTVDQEIQYVPIKMMNMVHKLSELSLCKIYLDGELLESEVSEDKVFFDAKSGVEFSLLDARIGMYSPIVKFKGADAQTSFRVPSFRIAANILSGNAKNYLELNRNKFTHKGNNNAFNSIMGSIDRNIDELTSFFKNEEIQRHLSLYSKVYLQKEIDDKWRNITLDVDGQIVQLGEILKNDTIEFTLERPNKNKKIIFSMKGSDLVLHNYLDTSGNYDQLLKLVDQLFLKKVIFTKDNKLHYKFEKSDNKSLNVTGEALIILTKNRAASNFIGARFTIPCPDKYNDLFIPEDYYNWGIRSETFKVKRMLSPIRKVDKAFDSKNISSYVKWLSEIKNCNEDVVKTSLKEFLNDLYSADNIKSLKLSSSLSEITKELDTMST